MKDSHSKEELDNLLAEELIDNILAKEQRIVEIMVEIKNILEARP